MHSLNISLPSSSDISSILTKAGKTAGFPLGFIYGATAQNPVSLSVSDFEQRIIDTIAEVSGVQVTFGGHTTTAVQTFKPTGFLNKGFWGYLALWAYDSLGLPYASVLKDTLGNFFIGYSVGGVFDPPIPQPPNQRAYNYANFQNSGGFSVSSGGAQQTGRSYSSVDSIAPVYSGSAYIAGGALI